MMLLNNIPLPFMYGSNSLQPLSAWLQKKHIKVQEKKFKGIGNSTNTLKIVKKGHHAGIAEVRPHKLFRGLRCWLSAFYYKRHIKPAASLAEYTTAATAIVNQLAENDRNAVVLSFHKSAHSALIIKHANEKYSYHSFGTGNLPSQLNLSLSDTENYFAKECSDWGDALEQNSVQYLRLDNLPMIVDWCDKNSTTVKFNLFTNNCSAYVRDILLMGYAGDIKKLQHNRDWQMPANTLELAKQINENNASRKQ